MSSPSPARSSDDDEGEPATTALTKTGSRRICCERSAEDANLLSIPNPPPRRNVTHGVMSERYHLGGRVETDTVAIAAARHDQAGIQRRHRLERRQGDDPSQTPPFTSLVARHEVSQGTEEPPPQFPINPALPDQPRRGRGRPPIPDDPIDPAQPRRGRGRPSLPHDPIDPPQSRRGRARPSLPDDPSDPAQPRPGRPRLPDAPLSDMVAAGDAMSAAHYIGSGRKFQAGFDKDKEPPLLSDGNEMDPGEVPEHLPALSQVEEMLIARVPAVAFAEMDDSYMQAREQQDLRMPPSVEMYSQ
ncbi:hypothetical protein V8E54_011033 [Elaphomyces granulatus]